MYHAVLPVSSATHPPAAPAVDAGDSARAYQHAHPPRAGPEARQVARRLDRPVRRRGELEQQWQAATGNGWMLLQSKQLLHADRQHRLLALILDRMPLAGRRFEMGWRKPAKVALQFVRHQRYQPVRKPGCGNLGKAAGVGLKGAEPLVQPGKQGAVADIRPWLADHPVKESDPLAKLHGLLREGKLIEPQLAHPSTSAG